MFQKILASVGIGNAKVDTKLTRSIYTAGDVVEGVVEIRGGNTAQQIDAIYVTVYTSYIKEVDDKKVQDEAAVARYEVGTGFTINDNELKEIPFRFNLPYSTPMSVGKTKVWIQTELDIKMAVDPNDRDYIEVRPTSLAAEIIYATKQLGFRQRSAECEKAPFSLRAPHPFVQEFEFSPTGQYRNYLDELEIIFVNQSASGVDLLIQVDRKVRGLGSLFSEALNLDESFIRLTIGNHQIAQVKQILQDVIERHK